MAKSCTYADKVYSNGAVICNDHGRKQKCSNGSWGLPYSSCKKQKTYAEFTPKRRIVRKVARKKRTTKRRR